MSVCRSTTCLHWSRCVTNRHGPHNRDGGLHLGRVGRLLLYSDWLFDMHRMLCLLSLLSTLYMLLR